MSDKGRLVKRTQKAECPPFKDLPIWVECGLGPAANPPQLGHFRDSLGCWEKYETPFVKADCPGWVIDPDKVKAYIAEHERYAHAFSRILRASDPHKDMGTPEERLDFIEEQACEAIDPGSYANVEDHWASHLKEGERQGPEKEAP